MSKETTFIFDDKNKKKREYVLNDKDYGFYKQALKDFDRSKSYIDSHYIHIWNKSMKSYYMYMGDRDSYIKDWQSNISLGLIRGKIDTYTAFLTDTPLQFNAVALCPLAHEVIEGRDDGYTHLDAHRDAITYIADTSEFGDEVALSLIEGTIL